MKSILFGILICSLLIVGCSGGSVSGAGSPKNQPVNPLSENSPMHPFVGSWNGNGSVARIDGNQTVSLNCEKVTVDILASSSTEFTYKNVFTCNGGQSSIASRETTFQLRDDNLFVKDQLIGTVTAGVINLHVVRDGFDLQWNLSSSGTHMTFTYVSQGNDTYFSERAELAR